MNQRQRAAYHEAGHAAAIHSLGELNGRVEIGSHGGGVTSNRHSLFFGTTITRADDLRISIAGSLAESWYCRYPVEDLLESQTGFGGSGDGDRVAALLNGDSLRHWIRKTESVLRGYQRRIQSLGDVLIERGSVSGAEAAAILRVR